MLTGFLSVSRHLYGQSKLGNIFLSDIFAAAHPGQVVAASVHPGAIATELARHLVGPKTKAVLEKVMGLVTFPASMGAYNSLWAGVVAPAEEVDGKVSGKGCSRSLCWPGDEEADA